MKGNCFVSIYLDIRRAKSNGKFPVKLRLFVKHPRKQKLYNTDFDLTEKEFKSIWETLKPRSEHKHIRKELQSIETRANEIVDSLKIFSFEAFETMLYGENYNFEKEIDYYYKTAIAHYKSNDRVNTASNYELSLKSLLKFHDKLTISFCNITPQWLSDYENYMVEKMNRSRTTVGIYLRPLRAIFNTAISEKSIDPELYPFGKRKYAIPAPRSIKKALSKEYLKILFDGIPKTPEQDKAKDFWFFSYACNGINFKDISNLQYKNISGEYLYFRRSKTYNTNKTQAPVEIYLTELVLKTIEKWGNPDKSPENYIFSITDHFSTATEKLRQLQNFIRYINQHFLNYAKSVGIDENISTYWARHSFATNAQRNGSTVYQISEAMGHANSNTTEIYLGRVQIKDKKEMAIKLIEF